MCLTFQMILALKTCDGALTFERKRYIIPFHSQSLISNLPYCLQYSSYNVSYKNLDSNQLIIPLVIISLFPSGVCLILNKFCKENSVLIIHSVKVLKVALESAAKHTAVSLTKQYSTFNLR